MLAVDLPFVTATLLRWLVAQAWSSRGVVVRGAGGFEPLCAVYPKSILSAFLRARQRGAFALQPLLTDGVAGGWMLAIDAPDPASFAYWNTPEDRGSVTPLGRSHHSRRAG